MLGGKTLWHLPVYCIAKIVWGGGRRHSGWWSGETQICCAAVTHCDERGWKDSLTGTWERKKGNFRCVNKDLEGRLQM